jgi:hypothetical protein
MANELNGLFSVPAPLFDPHGKRSGVFHFLLQARFPPPILAFIRSLYDGLIDPSGPLRIRYAFDA